MKRIHSCPTFQHLPEEIIYEILSTLPVRDISRCRFVCRDWFKIIKNPSFVQLHHSKIKQGDNHTSLLACHMKICYSTLYLLNPLGDSSLTASTGINNLPPKKTTKLVTLVGSSNGLICLSSQPALCEYEPESFYICNPITKDTVKLPKIVTPEPWHESSSGFAYEAITDTYKVFHTWSYRKKPVGPVYTGVEIFTLGSKEWKRSQDISTLFDNSVPILLNGALHWETRDVTRSEYYDCVGAINVTTEKFKAFKQPPLCFNLNLCAVGGKLCVVSDESIANGTINLWIMNDYGSAESWTKKFIVERATLGPFKNAFFTLFGTKNAEVVMLVGKERQGYYDLEKKEFQNIKIQGEFPRVCNPHYQLNFVVHLGSLISPTEINRTRGYSKSMLHEEVKT